MESANKTHWKLHINSSKIQKKIEYNENFDDDSIRFFVIHPQSDRALGQMHCCHNSIASFFEKRNSPFKQEIPEIKTKKQTLDHYIKSICIITSYYGIFTIKKVPPQPNQTTHQIQTDDIDTKFQKTSQNLLKKYTN